MNLYELKAPFTAVYFWDPTCGNCSKTSKKLVPVYEKYKKYGFEVFGICSKTWKELDQCKKKIKDQKMEFINTSEEAYPLAVAKKMYDIKVNPYIMLLDADKKIMWKRIDPKQVDEILAREYEKLGIEIEVSDEIQKAVDDALKVQEKKNEQKAGVKGGGH
jgi:peroxiredoxin